MWTIIPWWFKFNGFFWFTFIEFLIIAMKFCTWQLCWCGICKVLLWDNDQQWHYSVVKQILHWIWTTMEHWLIKQVQPDTDYRQIFNIRCTLTGNKIVDHSDVVGASPVGAAPTTSSFSTPTPEFKRLHKDNCKTRQETFKLCDLVHLILEIWQYCTSIPHRCGPNSL